MLTPIYRVKRAAYDQYAQDVMISSVAEYALPTIGHMDHASPRWSGIVRFYTINRREHDQSAPIAI